MVEIEYFNNRTHGGITLAAWIGDAYTVEEFEDEDTGVINVVCWNAGSSCSDAPLFWVFT